MEKLSRSLLVDGGLATALLHELLSKSLSVTGRLLAASGSPALALLARAATPEKPALILLAVGMPVAGGTELLGAYHLSVAGLMSKPATKEKAGSIL